MCGQADDRNQSGRSPRDRTEWCVRYPETASLLRYPANAESLLEAIDRAQRGELEQRDLLNAGQELLPWTRTAGSTTRSVLSPAC